MLASIGLDLPAWFGIIGGIAGWMIGGVGFFVWIKGAAHRAKYDQLLEDNKGWENSVKQRDTRIKDLEDENKLQASRMHELELKMAQFQNQPLAIEGMQADLREMQKLINESTRASNDRQSQLMLSQNDLMKGLLKGQTEDKKWSKILEKHSEVIEELLKASIEQRVLISNILEYVKPPEVELASK